MESSAKTPHEVLEVMLGRDRFSAWMGLEVDEIGSGFCRLHYRVTETMLNGYGVIHGGVLFSAADSDVSISYVRPAREGELLMVEAKEEHAGNRIGIYDVRTTNAQGELVALFKGTAYRTGKPVQ
jgi:acyl-CoA thioesterase